MAKGKTKNTGGGKKGKRRPRKSNGQYAKKS
jgi:hypothetical protein